MGGTRIKLTRHMAGGTLVRLMLSWLQSENTLPPRQIMSFGPFAKLECDLPIHGRFESWLYGR